MRISYNSEHPLEHQCAMPNCEYSSDTDGYHGGFVEYDRKYYCSDCVILLVRLRHMALWIRQIELYE